jgi:hypothetical protein
MSSSSYLTFDYGCHRPRRRTIQYSEASVIESRSCGVLDTPLSRGTTIDLAAGLICFAGAPNGGQNGHERGHARKAQNTGASTIFHTARAET